MKGDNDIITSHACAIVTMDLVGQFTTVNDQVMWVGPRSCNEIP